MHTAVRPLESGEVMNVTDVQEAGGSCLASDVEYRTFQGTAENLGERRAKC